MYVLILRIEVFSEHEHIDIGTANLKIIDVRYHDFNGFPVVNWY